MEPTFALLLRMVIGLLLGLTLMALFSIKLDSRRGALKVYLYSGVSLAVGMLLTYSAARHISSGLMSLCFGLTPILAGWFAQKIIAEAKFTVIKKIALTVALAGLALASIDNIDMGMSSALGFALVLSSVVIFSLSGVLIKSVSIEMNPLCTTVGSLIVALPFFIIAWLISTGGVLQYEQWQSKAIYSAVYLGVFASLIGYLAYFYVLKKLPVTTVGLIVMVTPVLANGLGVLVNGEYLSTSLVLGATLVICGLSLFQFGHQIKMFRRNKHTNEEVETSLR